MDMMTVFICSYETSSTPNSVKGSVQWDVTGVEIELKEAVQTWNITGKIYYSQRSKNWDLGAKK